MRLSARLGRAPIASADVALLLRTLKRLSAAEGDRCRHENLTVNNQRIESGFIAAANTARLTSQPWIRSSSRSQVLDRDRVLMWERKRGLARRGVAQATASERGCMGMESGRSDIVICAIESIRL